MSGSSPELESKERRIAADNEAVSDLALRASRNALESAQIAPDELDLIICATITGDMQFPATASIVQDKLGASGGQRSIYRQAAPDSYTQLPLQRVDWRWDL